jgi:hypothetical protein
MRELGANVCVTVAGLGQQVIVDIHNKVYHLGYVQLLIQWVITCLAGGYQRGLGAGVTA